MCESVSRRGAGRGAAGGGGGLIVQGVGGRGGCFLFLLVVDRFLSGVFVRQLWCVCQAAVGLYACRRCCCAKQQACLPGCPFHSLP